MKMAGRPAIRLIAIVILGLGAVAASWHQSAPAPMPAAILVLTPSVAPTPELLTESVRIRSGDTLERILSRGGLESAMRLNLITAIRKEFDVRKFRAGSELTLVRSPEGELVSLEYALDPERKLQLAESSGEFVARIVEQPGTLSQQVVCGTLKGSLFESMARAGEQPELAIRMAEIFAWDIDFYRDPQPGDRFCLVVEKKEFDSGAQPVYQRVLAAEYDNAGKVYDAFLFRNADGEDQYYSAEGKSLQAAFLKSPLAFDARISSHFSNRRLHPVLGVYRAHLGTDYAAPVGTPVLAVSAGRVIFSGYSGGSGNLITLQHSNGFITQYLHLSKRLVKKGDSVKQGQRIGLVGMTGLASGPHVDIRIQKNGKYLNWAKLKMPRQAGISPADLAKFEAYRDALAIMIEGGLERGPELAASQSSVVPTP